MSKQNSVDEQPDLPVEVAAVVVAVPEEDEAQEATEQQPKHADLSGAVTSPRTNPDVAMPEATDGNWPIRKQEAD